MKYQKTLVLLVILNLAALVIVTFQLPDQIPIHANLQGVFDGWTSRWFAPLMGIIPVVLLVGAIAYNRHIASDSTVRRNEKVQNILIMVLVLLFAMLSWLPMVMAWCADDKGMGSLPMELIIGLPMGVAIILISNYMGVIRPNHWMGIRTKWTFSSEEIWKRTHRLAGCCGVLAGVLMICGSLAAYGLKIPVMALVCLMISLILFVGVPMVYSYRLYRQMNSKD